VHFPASTRKGRRLAGAEAYRCGARALALQMPVRAAAVLGYRRAGGPPHPRSRATVPVQPRHRAVASGGAAARPFRDRARSRCGSGIAVIDYPIRIARRPVSRVLSPLARGMTIHLGRPLRGASRDRPGRRLGNPPAGLAPGVPSLFGLAPGGVCRAASVTGGAGRSYRSVSPLPAWPGQARVRLWRSLLCGTVPGVAPAGCYPAPRFHGARTFLPRIRMRRRPSGRLAGV